MTDPEPTNQRHEEQLSDEPTSEETPKPMQIEEQSAAYPVAYSVPGPTSPYLHTTKPQNSPTQQQYSPTYSPPRAMSTTTSPNLYPQVMSAVTSPNLYPQAMSTVTSPNLYPQQYPSSEHGHDQVDTEATHALLLLADGSRRSSGTAHSSSPEKRGRGMSVKDLLSS